MDLIKEEDAVFSEELVNGWRSGVLERREELFRKNWKNRRPVVPLKSRQQERTFEFVVQWYEEFEEVVGRERERSRLDRLIERGLDVNAPENKKTGAKR
ncbi:MAG: hypothetical protein LBT97_08535 [Planctomycetota bacterium]|nr:hypothetical protein [Planctomycetota bacterium]